ncbi:tRNA (guanine-N(7)-)-methyltransferase [Phytophthora boehmeriae]|uniref:tRNA (guanine-N(7)-)-methyltransferase n=1 Tax=Phytophthora boehmeriae TaxID=109152 RepID=A0A8T1WSX7_9STRA|nr:tRNA (guanine-N(7)-)-methyltransferase [Phytophthora boehmeriae]
MAEVATTKAEEAQQQALAGKAPQKKFYRSRAHCNPLSHNDCFEYPRTPSEMDWSTHYPGIENPSVDFLDVGLKLAELYPDKLTLALEIRAKVTEYVRLRIEALRAEHQGQFQNVSALRTNAMRYLPQYFRKGQISKMFFCFPDPQFKARLHRRRIVHTPLLAEYAYLLAPGGILYTITDVEELHQWHVEKCSSHPCFTRIPDSELDTDPCVKAMTEETEEGKKVARGGGKKYVAVFRRKANEDVAVDNLFW